MIHRIWMDHDSTNFGRLWSVSIFCDSRLTFSKTFTALNAQFPWTIDSWISCLPESFPELCFQSQPSWLRSLPRKWASGKQKKKHVPFPKTRQKPGRSLAKRQRPRWKKKWWILFEEKKIWTGKQKWTCCALCQWNRLSPGMSWSTSAGWIFGPRATRGAWQAWAAGSSLASKKRKLCAKCMMLHGSLQVQIEALSVYAIWMFPK